MLKTISAALLAVSVLAAPALAGAAKTTQAPTVKSEQAKTKTTERAKTGVLNANAKMGRHHHKHHRSHKHMGALKTHKFSKVSIKHVAPATKRG
jgi:Ni/Co efflux regulator RcnB